MNGLNLILSFTGQEYVWQKFYSSIGLTDAEIKEFFSGAAFLAWQRMGNIQGWGGPLDDGWITAQSELQEQIVAQTRQFGMINVLPGFAGHVPKALIRVFPSANLTRNAGWNGFGANYSEDYLLEPTDPLFVTLGKKYYELIIEEYGTDHVFNMDTYNEMNPSNTDLDFLADTNEAIYVAMSSVDPDGIFLMQGWLFHSTGVVLIAACNSMGMTQRSVPKGTVPFGQPFVVWQSVPLPLPTTRTAKIALSLVNPHQRVGSIYLSVLPLPPVVFTLRLQPIG